MFRRGRRRIREAAEAAGDVATWDPLDIGTKPYDRDQVWSSSAPEPPGELKRYAESRGLRWVSEAALGTAYCLFDIEKGRDLNTTRGTLPGGPYVVLGHRRREHTARGSGVTDSGVQAEGVAAKIGEGHTFVAVQVPETKTTVVAMNARATQLEGDPFGPRLEPLPNDGPWRLDLHQRADRPVFDAIWRGPAGERVRERYPWGPAQGLNRKPAAGGRLDIRAGLVSVWAPGYIEDPDELDALVSLTIEVAGDVRAACAPAVRQADFAQPLPPPTGWTDASRRSPDNLRKAIEKVKAKRVRVGASKAEDITDPGASEEERWAGVRDFASSYAASRDLALEDGRAFDQAQPSLPLNGWAQFSCRGELPGGAPYRVVVSALRPYLWRPGWSAAGVLAVTPAPPGTPDRPLEHSEDGYLVAVQDGLRCTTTYATQMELSHADMDGAVAALQSGS